MPSVTMVKQVSITDAEHAGPTAGPQPAERFREHLKQLLQVHDLPVPQHFAMELLESCPRAFARLEDDDRSEWHVCELHYQREREEVLNLREGVRGGTVAFEPLVAGPLFPDPRSGVFGLSSPAAGPRARFAIISHGGRKGVTFKQRIDKIVDVQRAFPQLAPMPVQERDAPDGMNVHFELVLPSAYLYGWVNDFLIFPHAGASALTLGETPETAPLLASILSRFLQALEAESCVLPDFTPRNLVYRTDGGVMRVGLCDLEHGVARRVSERGDEPDSEWARALSRNALEFLYALRHAPTISSADPLSPARLRSVFRSNPRVHYFEETLIKEGLLQAVGGRDVYALRDLLLARFFESPEGMEAYFHLRAAWDRLPPSSFTAVLGAVMTADYDLPALIRAVSTSMLAAATVEYLHTCPEGVGLLRARQMWYPSTVVCERMIASYLGAAHPCARGRADPSWRQWLEVAPVQLGFAPVYAVDG